MIEEIGFRGVEQDLVHNFIFHVYDSQTAISKQKLIRKVSMNGHIKKFKNVK